MCPSKSYDRVPVNRTRNSAPRYVRSLIDGDQHNEPIYIRGSHNNLSKDDNPRRLDGLGGNAFSGPGSGRQNGPAGCQANQSAHRQGSCQPIAETPIRYRNRRHHERLRKDGDRAHPSGATRLPSYGLYGQRLVPKAHDPKMVLTRVPHVFCPSRQARKRIPTTSCCNTCR